MRKILTWLITLTMMFMLFSESAAASDTGESAAKDTDTLITLPVTCEGVIFGGRMGDKVPAEVSFDPTWLTEGDPKEYHAALAEFSTFLCTDASFRDQDLMSGIQNRAVIRGYEDAYSASALLNAFGFAEVRKIDICTSPVDTVDPEDSVSMTLGYLPTENYDVYTAAIHGCLTAPEWVSLFDIGSTAPAYEAFTGEHPDWQVMSHVKGIDVSKVRAVRYIESFMAESGDPERPDRLLLTGHSRGGAIANLAGAYFERDTELESFTYTFNAIPCVKSENVPVCRTIFNLFPSEDFFSRIYPFYDGSLKRYGTDLSLGAVATEGFMASLGAMTGRSDYAFLSTEQYETYMRLFGECFKNPDALYTMRTEAKTFRSKAEADAQHDFYSMVISGDDGFAVGHFAALGDVTLNDEQQYGFTFSYCDAALLQGIAMLLACGPAAGQNVRAIFSQNEAAVQLIDFLINFYSAVFGGHELAFDCILSQKIAPPTNRTARYDRFSRLHEKLKSKLRDRIHGHRGEF